MQRAKNLSYLTDYDVAIHFNVSRATIWRWSASNSAFPKPRKLGPNTSRWHIEDLNTFEEHLQSTCVTSFATPLVS